MVQWNEHVPLSPAQADAELSRCTRVLLHWLPEFTADFRDSNSADGFYPAAPNVEWTTGFQTGMYWLGWEHSHAEALRAAAELEVESFLKRIQDRVDVDHHDMGFLYTPSCVAAYRLTGSETGRRAALLAADNLASRFQGKGQFIQAWGTLGAPDNYRLIVDCLLNLPLLYWASRETKDPRYEQIARAHTKTSLSLLVRPDNSCYHTYFLDPETGAPVRGVTRPGYKDGSAWARGQAWAIYGLALCRRHTGDESCLPLFWRVTQYFLNHLPADGVPYWDLCFTEGDEPRDSSASAIAACGMLEMANYVDAAEAATLRRTAARLASALTRTCTVEDEKACSGLLLHGVYAKDSPYNPIPKDRGVDECNTWGDYFYMELLTRLARTWDPYW